MSENFKKGREPRTRTTFKVTSHDLSVYEKMLKLQASEFTRDGIMYSDEAVDRIQSQILAQAPPEFSKLEGAYRCPLHQKSGEWPDNPCPVCASNALKLDLSPLELDVEPYKDIETVFTRPSSGDGDWSASGDGDWSDVKVRKIDGAYLLVEEE